MKTPQVCSRQWEAEEKIYGAQWIGDALVPDFAQGAPGELLALHRVGRIN